jgi:multidrug efflux pump subunit AcrA (membrane-fusion protein)
LAAAAGSAAELAERRVPDRSAKSWRGRKRRPLVIGTAIVVALLVAGGATAWAASSSGDAGFRMTDVVRTSVDSTLGVVGTIEPVNDASPSFQVGGKVSSVTVAAGDQVTAGETLASLDTTSLSESLSSAELSLQSDDAKLTEDEDSETSGSASATSATASTSAAKSASTTTSNSGGDGGQISQDQAALVADTAKSSADQQQETADLAQAETACGISGTPTPSKPSAPSGASPTSTTTTTPTTTTPTTSTSTGSSTGCSAAIQQVSTDEQAVSTDQQEVAGDESTLAKALTQEATSSSGGSSTTTPSTASSGSTSSGGSGASGASGKSSSSAGAASDSATQIASDEATIDTAQANVIEAEQSLAEGQLTSPINGTIASVGITTGDTVSADSSTDVIVIVGTKSFEATGTLTSTQVPLVKVGSSADVSVDGTTGTIHGTVTQVGPVQSSDSGYSYPVVVTLPASANSLFSGSSANLSIVTGQKKDVLAVPTSAVMTSGTQSFVQVLSGSKPVDKPVKVGVIGSIYTEVLSGVTRGEAVVLANDATPVPASNTSTVGGFGGGGLGGTGGFGGGGRFSSGASPLSG